MILELFNALMRRLEFLLRDLKIAMKIRNNSSRLTTNGHSQALFLAKLSDLAANVRSNAPHLIYNLEDIASAMKGSSNLFTKERRNLHVISDSLLSALASKAGRRSISSTVVAKADEVSTTRKTRHYIMLACDDEASRDLLLVFVFVFATSSISIYQHRRSESESSTTLIAKSERLLYIKSN